MLRSLFAVVALATTATNAFAAPAPACPMINGEFTRADSNSAIKVKTIRAGHRFVYQFSGFTAVADGIARKTEVNGSFLTMEAACQGGAVQIKVTKVDRIQEVEEDEAGNPVTRSPEVTSLTLIPYDQNVLEIASSNLAVTGIYLRGKPAAPKHNPMQ